MIVVPGLPLVTSGPYRWFAHPNYVAVVVEGVALPMVHAAWVTALVFTVANAFLLARPAAGREHRAGAGSRRGRRMRDLLVVGRRAGRARHRAARRPRRARRRGARAPRRRRRQGLRRGADARRGRAARRARHRARRAPDRRHPLPRGRAAASTRASATAPGAACDARCCTPACATRRRGRRGAAHRARRARRSAGATTGWSSTASRRAGWSPPTACTRPYAGWSVSTTPVRARPPLRSARARTPRPLDLAGRGALVATSARPT